MSANAWNVCPRCAENLALAIENAEQKVINAYGIASQANYKLLQSHYEELKRSKSVESFRQEWEVYMIGHVVKVGYSGVCQECGFNVHFNHEHSFSID